MRTLRRRWPRLAEILDDLLVECPLRYPLRVEVHKRLRVEGEPCYGGTFLSRSTPRRFTIRLDGGQGYATARDTVIHEYAHALALATPEHNARWGREYARAYRVAERRIG